MDDKFKKNGLLDGGGSEWDESEHPRDGKGQFAKKGATQVNGNDKIEKVGLLTSAIKKVADKKQERINVILAERKEKEEKRQTEQLFREQLIQVQNGTFDRRSFLNLGITPKILTEKTGIPRLPLMMPYTKAYLSINKNGEIKGNYHGLGIETLSHLPTALHSPKYIFKHDYPNRIEVVVELKDKRGKNILASIEFDTRAVVNKERMKANVVVTAFSPRKENYIKNRISNGKLLYEKKS